MTGKISHFEALMITDLVDKKYVYETFGCTGDIEEVLKRVEPELHEKVLQNEISVFRAMLEADLIDAVALYRTIVFKAKIQDVYEVQVEGIEESDRDLLQETEDL